MGPEPESSGKHPKGLAYRHGTIMLQWGRSRKAPENYLFIDILHKNLLTLQWGRSRKAPENSLTKPKNNTRENASMGPEPESSGKPHGFETTLSTMNTLQWGRSRKAPENGPLVTFLKQRGICGICEGSGKNSSQRNLFLHFRV